MRINKKQFKKWIEALDSGEYKQTKGTLQDKKGYCCLGVGCKVLVPEDKLVLDKDGFIEGGIPDWQTHSPEWLKKITEHFAAKTQEDFGLTGLNDDKGYTFPEIATMLELVYIHKAFK
jgi:hypothetical protein